MKKIEKQPRLAVGYTRVSSPGQAAHGISLEAQKARIEGWAKSNSVELAGIYTDAGISGTRRDRPELEQAMKMCGKGSVLVVYSLSRMGRSTRHLLELSERLKHAGADLVSLSESIDTTSAAGRMIFGVLATLAQFEAELAGERTAAALRHKIDMGESPNGIGRYGFKAVPHATKRNRRGLPLLILKPVAAELKIVERVKRLRSRGLSLQRIADRLTEEGFKPRGAYWHVQTVSNIIQQQQI